jgi:hypothetical protein
MHTTNIHRSLSQTLSNSLATFPTFHSIIMVNKTAPGHTTTKIVYKPDSQSTEEYIGIINPEEVRCWIQREDPDR